MNKKIFSIVIPTYEFNGKGVEYLNHNLNIIKSQTFQNFEIIITDDSQNDDIKNLVEFWKTELNIKYFKNNRENFKSHSKNVNNGLENSNGDWIKILFQDDFLYDENSLMNQVNFIKNNPKMNWFFTKFYHTVDGKNLYNLYSPKWNNNVIRGNNTLGGPSGLTIKNIDLPKFDNELMWLMDCDFYQKNYIKYGEPLICNEITVVNRTSSDQLTTLIPEELKIKEHNIVNLKYA